ncbi:MAG: histidine phosphatase family protein [Rhodobacteraceae bacterium]|nr:histidine phosphatase family protein [Paracoccaceae bacterium]
MTNYPELFVLRHGQTEWNKIGKFQGVMNSDLTKKGREQARAQGRILKGLAIDMANTNCFASPLGRTRETAALALGDMDQSLWFDDRLKEINFGRWEGLTQTEMALGWPGAGIGGVGHDWHFKSPGGERFADMAARVQSFLDELNGPAIIVTHGITSLLLRGLWRGLSRDSMLAQSRDQGCVYHLSKGQEHCVWES